MWTGLVINAADIASQSVEFINAFWMVAVVAIGAPFGLSILAKSKGIFN